MEHIVEPVQVVSHLFEVLEKTPRHTWYNDEIVTVGDKQYTTKVRTFHSPLLLISSYYEKVIEKYAPWSSNRAALFNEEAVKVRQLFLDGLEALGVGVEFQPMLEDYSKLWHVVGTGTEDR